MTREDGFAVLRWLLTRPPSLRVPVIVLTASSERDRDEALRLGAAACVAKPFDLDDLAATVRRLLPATEAGAPPPGRPS